MITFIFYHGDSCEKQFIIIIKRSAPPTSIITSCVSKSTKYLSEYGPRDRVHIQTEVIFDLKRFCKRDKTCT
jgi:hypothetical protein